MAIKEIRRAQLVKGGDIIKQGETFTLGFLFFDANDRIIQLGTSDVVTVKVANKTGVIKELSASKVEDRIEFSINENIGHGEMRVEFTVTNGSNTQKYPAGDWVRLNITPSLDDAGAGGIIAITATQMFSRITGAETKATNAETKATAAQTTANNVQRDFDQILTEAGDSNPEIVAARLGEENLRVFNEKVTTQLAETEKDFEQREINVKRLGAIGDGSSHPLSSYFSTLTEAKVKYPHATSLTQELDWAVIQGVLNENLSPYFPKGNYLFNTPLIKNYSTNCTWRGESAKLTYTGSHAEYAVRLSGVGVSFDLQGLTIDGSFKCNKGLEVLANAPNMNIENQGFFSLKKSKVKNVKRLNTFSNGDGIYVRGAFGIIEFDNVEVTDVVLPAGQGTMGIVGVSGITTLDYGVSSYPKKVTLNRCFVANIKSEDLSYQYDQDGLRAFVPHVTTAGAFIDSELIVTDSRFKNCFGRSIKSQTFVNHTKDCFFERDSGLSSNKGNNEIDYQVGGGSISSCTFNYKNGFQPAYCVSLITKAGYGKPSLSVRDCEVYLDEATTLDGFQTNFSIGGGSFGLISLKDIRVYGKTKALSYSYTPDNKTVLKVRDCFVNALANGPTAEKSLIYAASLDGVAPYHQFITVEDCVYGGEEKPSMVRDAISGNSTTSTVSSTQNIGFSNDKQRSANASGLKSDQISRLGRIGSDIESGQNSGAFDIKYTAITAGASVKIPVRNISLALIFIVAGTNSTGYAFIASNFNANVPIAKGAGFEIGNATEPATGVFRVWSSAQNEITIKNTDAVTRQFSIYEMSSI